MQQLEQIFKNLPKQLEWKSFYVHDFPLVREICKDIRKISLENQLNKSQIKAISEVKKISEGAYQHIVNNTQSSDTLKNENKNQGENTASIYPLKDMRAREIILSYFTDSGDTLLNYFTGSGDALVNYFSGYYKSGDTIPATTSLS